MSEIYHGSRPSQASQVPSAKIKVHTCTYLDLVARWRLYSQVPLVVCYESSSESGRPRVRFPFGSVPVIESAGSEPQYRLASGCYVSPGTSKV